MESDSKSLPQLQNVFLAVLMILKTFLLFTVKLVSTAVILPLSFISFALNSILIPLNKLISFPDQIAIRKTKSSRLISKSLNNTGKSTEKNELSDKNTPDYLGNNYKNKSSEIITEMSLKQYNNLKQYKAYTGRLNDIMVINKKIHNVIQMIEDLALQTNTLSLNAAVESAKAGDNENGFARISSGLKILSKNTVSALREINHILNDTIEKIPGNMDILNPEKDIDELYYRIKNLFNACNAGHSSFTKKTESHVRPAMRIKSISNANPVSTCNKNTSDKTAAPADNLNESNNFIKDKKPTLH
ncbi:MAG: hypothetical protein JW864_12290 [Spirochaetes bacterium]|nr:hypothetical protein [Spirochaetota bacterium]